MLLNTAVAFSDVICASPCVTSAAQVDEAVARTLVLLERRITESLHESFPEGLPPHGLPPAAIIWIMEEDLAEAKVIDRTIRLIQLSSVSPSWRSTALDSPQLWTTIVSSDPPHLIELSLARSKQLPLMIIFNSTYSRSLDETSFLNMIRPHQSRWGEIFFKWITSESTAVSFRDTAAPGYPELTSLKLLGSSSYLNLDVTFDLAVRATRLIELKIYHLRVNVTQLLETIAASSQLASLELHGLVSDSASNTPDPEPPSSPAKLIDVTTLNLHSLQSSIFISLFKYIRTAQTATKITIYHNFSNTDTYLETNDAPGVQGFSDWVSNLTWET